jgi:hypothetical protein
MYRVQGTVDRDIYRNIIIQLISLLEVDECDYRFQQDGVMCHTSKEMMSILKDCFWWPLFVDLVAPKIKGKVVPVL